MFELNENTRSCGREREQRKKMIDGDSKMAESLDPPPGRCWLVLPAEPDDCLPIGWTASQRRRHQPPHPSWNLWKRKKKKSIGFSSSFWYNFLYFGGRATKKRKKINYWVLRKEQILQHLWPFPLFNLVKLLLGGAGGWKLICFFECVDFLMTELSSVSVFWLTNKLTLCT